MVTKYLEELIEAISVSDLEEADNLIDEIEYHLKDGKEELSMREQECFDLVQDSKIVFDTDEDLAVTLVEMALDVYTLPTVDGFIFNRAEERTRFNAIREHRSTYNKDFTPIERTQFEMGSKRIVRDFLNFLKTEHSRRFGV